MSFWIERKLNTLTFILVILLLATAAANIIKLDYLITAPGVALPLEEIITVEKGEKDAIGSFFLTAVTSREATLSNYLYIKFFKPKGFELEPREESIPQGMDDKRYMEIMEDMMTESQMSAKFIGLKEMGYQTSVSGHGAKVMEIMEESKAKGLLREGDIIVGIDGEKVNLASEAVALIQKHRAGEMVKITVKRSEELLDFKIKTLELKDNPKKASVGIYIMTYLREYNFPLDVDIATANIVGPSAGMMFTLEIINQIDPVDLTKGFKIAGTGTIDLEGIVGPIEGVTQKVYAAEAQGADYFLAPVENYAEAAKAATKLQVVKVSTIDDALNFLRKLPPKKRK